MAAETSGDTTANGAQEAALTVLSVGLESLTLLAVGVSLIILRLLLFLRILLLLLTMLGILLLLLTVLGILLLLLLLLVSVVRSGLALAGLRVAVVAAVVAHDEGWVRFR